jgi:hypothetical protein
MNRNKKGIIQQISKRFETTIIGSLVRFEESFGYLWGLDSNKPLTAKEQDFLDMWEILRTSILNHGNNQMRMALDDIINYIEDENQQNKYRVTLINDNLKHKNDTGDQS